MKAYLSRTMVVLVVAGLCATSVWPQDSSSPKPAARTVWQTVGGDPSSGAANSGDEMSLSNSKSELLPDSRPLTGSEMLTLGSLGGQPSYVVSNFSFQEIADSNGSSARGASTFNYASFLSGGFTLRHVGRFGELSASYQGGGRFYNGQSQSTESFHGVSFSQRIMWGRWSLLLSDQASYLPESSFGYAGAGFGGLANNPLPNGQGFSFGSLNPALVPNQAILTGRTNRISNVVVSDLQYNLSRRSVVTISGSYGILHFLDKGFTDNNSVTLQTGYSYSVSRNDSLGLLYGYSHFTFNGSSNALENHVVQAVYGRRITGRLALELAGGPQVSRYKLSSTSTTVPGQVLQAGLNQTVSATVGAQLRYSRGRSGYTLWYLHGITGGAGVFSGAKSDILNGNVNRELSRRWSAGVGVGYAHNTALQQTTLGTNNYDFTSYTGGPALSFRIGRTLRGVLSYGIDRQTSGVSICAGANCISSFTRHQISIGFDWSSRQIPIG